MDGSRRSVLITGGTGSLGRRLIADFVASGYEVCFQYFRDSTQAQDLEGRFAAKAIQMDLELLDVSRIPDVDILINSAAINTCDDVTAEVEPQVWRQTLEINLTAPYLLSRHLLPYMVKQKWDRIINISSTFGFRAVEGNLSYTVSKHGLRGLTGTIAKEYFDSGVTCNEICPGAMDSELLRRIAAREASVSGRTAADHLSEIAESYPGGQLMSVATVSAAALFLCSDSAHQINGVSIPIDAGLTC